MGNSGKLRNGCGLIPVLFWMTACGGAAAETRPKPSSAPEHELREEAAKPPSEDEAAEEEAPKNDACADGTCSACGSGICPSGWYCDETAAGGPACGWLPECTERAGCKCVTGKLGAGCTCSEQAGGLHVTCKAHS